MENKQTFLRVWNNTTNQNRFGKDTSQCLKKHNSTIRSSIIYSLNPIGSQLVMNMVSFQTETNNGLFTLNWIASRTDSVICSKSSQQDRPVSIITIIGTFQDNARQGTAKGIQRILLLETNWITLFVCSCLRLESKSYSLPLLVLIKITENCNGTIQLVTGESTFPLPYDKRKTSKNKLQYRKSIFLHTRFNFVQVIKNFALKRSI